MSSSLKLFALVFLLGFSSLSFSQDDSSTLSPADFVGGDNVFTVNDGSINFYYSGDGDLLEEPSWGRLWGDRIREGEEIAFTGYRVMGEPGSEQVYYSVGRVTGMNDGEPVIEPVERNGEDAWISAEDLIESIGAPVAGCDMLPIDALRLRHQEGALRTPERRPGSTLQQNLLDIAEMRDALVEEYDVQVPALTDDYQFADGCLNFIAGEDQLGEWGEFLVSEIIGTNRGEEYHADVDPQYFFEVPEGYFGDACPNFNSMSTGQKLGFWVATITALALKESTCNEGTVNSRATNGTAEGLLQAGSSWRNRITRDSNGRIISVILGRESRGPGCAAETQEPSGRWLTDYRDSLTCGVQIIGDILCGGYSTNFGSRPVCIPDSRPTSFFGPQFGRETQSHQYFGPLIGAAAHDRPKREFIQNEMRRVPGCVDQ